MKVSDFLTAADLMTFEKGLRVTIKSVERIEIDGRPRIVLFFEEVDKGLILDRENYRILKDWIGAHPLIEEYFARGESGDQ